jgi:hypothetical protein
MAPFRAALRGLASGAWSRVRLIVETPALRWRALGVLGVALVFVVALRELLGPFFHDRMSFGFHDWDAHSAYRYITPLSLKHYHEPPWWNPYQCGGFPAWAYVEGATNFVSPYLPLYLALPIQLAERFEVLGSALTGLASTYFLAGRFTKSNAVRAFVAVSYAINGRWALQATTGHTWHLQYAWLPLALYFFDRSFEPKSLRWSVYAGVVLAVIAYSGGIYPLPHTALVLVLYAVAFCAARRTLQPFVSLAATSVLSVAFAAPKLFPMIDLMQRFPRKIESTEHIDLGQLTALLFDPHQSYTEAPVAVSPYGWHEYGMYVGPVVGVAVFLGFVAARGARAITLRVVGLVMFLLGMGAFHKAAPWTLLHELPIFSSQHVPTRFLYPASLLLMLGFAALVGPGIDRVLERRGWLDLVLLGAVCWVAIDIASVGRKSTEHAFYMQAPPIVASQDFQQASTSPYNYSPPDWAGATLLSMFANTGDIKCYGVPQGLVPGAIARDSKDYRGEAYIVGASGNASVTKWTPNTATIDYSGAGSSALLVYNMNYDPSWRANGGPGTEYKGAIAVPIPPGAGAVKFVYRPRMLNWGILTLMLAVVGILAPRVWRRRRERRAGSTVPHAAESL